MKKNRTTFLLGNMFFFILISLIMIAVSNKTYCQCTKTIKVKIIFHRFYGDQVRLFCDGICVFDHDSLDSYDAYIIDILIKEKSSNTYYFEYKEIYDKSTREDSAFLYKKLNYKIKCYEFKVNHKEEGRYLYIHTKEIKSTLYTPDEKSRLIGNLGIDWYVTPEMEVEE